MNDKRPRLPEYDPRPDLWSRIEDDLARNTESSIEPWKRTVQELPAYEPKANLWETIEQELDQPVIRPLWTKTQPQWLWTGLAAAVIVIIGVWSFLASKSTEQVRIEYTVENTSKPLPLAPTESRRRAPADKRAEEFIARQCAEQQIACQRPEVHELRNQLVELSTEQQRIEHERQVFGDDPVLIRAQVKIDNQRAEIVKELITILRS